MKSIDEIRAFFCGDHFATGQGMTIDSVSGDSAVCGLELAPGHFNAVGRPQGGLIFTLADFAFAVAVNNQEADTVTLSSTINYLRPPKGTRLSAAAACIGRSKNVCFYQISVSDELGILVAQVATTGYTRHQLSK